MKNFIYLFTTFLFFNNSFAQNNESITVDILDEIKSPTSFDFFIQPVYLSITDQLINFGSGIYFDIDNISNKYSFHGKFIYNVAKFDRSKFSNSYQSSGFESKRANTIEAIFGYTLSIKENEKIKAVPLDKSGTTIYETELKLKKIETYEARLGFIQNNIFSSDDLTNTVESYRLFNHVNSISLGVSNTRSYKTKFNTDIYGMRYYYNKLNFYSDLLIGLPQTFPTMEKIADTYMDSENLTPVDQDLIQSHFKRLPVGLRLGVKSSVTSPKMDKFRFSTNFELGMIPGYYSSRLAPLFCINLGVAIGIINYR